MDKGIVGSMRECGVTESYKLKRQVVLSASEAAEMILRVDDSECHVLLRFERSLISLSSQSCDRHRGVATVTDV